MKINNVDFSDEFIKSFKNAADFVNDSVCKSFIDIAYVSEEDLINAFKLLANENTGIQQTASKVESTGSGEIINKSKIGADSGLAGSTVKQGANKKRGAVSKL
jgi:hypothetical protein